MDNNILGMIVCSFLAGWFARGILQSIIGYYPKWKEIKEKAELYDRERGKCPHGHVDWNDCPDCCH